MTWHVLQRTLFRQSITEAMYTLWAQLFTSKKKSKFPEHKTDVFWAWEPWFSKQVHYHSYLEIPTGYFSIP